MNQGYYRSIVHRFNCIDLIICSRFVVGVSIEMADS